MVPGHGCWTYANEGILLCLGLGLLLLDLLGVAALRVCIRLGFHFVICISTGNPGIVGFYTDSWDGKDR